MTNRILDFSSSPAHLHARGGTLEIKLESSDVHTVAFEDIAAVVVSHPQVTVSLAALARLAEAAREGRATRAELTGSTITITSLGPLGGKTPPHGPKTLPNHDFWLICVPSGLICRRLLGHIF